MIGWLEGFWFLLGFAAATLFRHVQQRARRRAEHWVEIDPGTSTMIGNTKVINSGTEMLRVCLPKADQR